MNAYYFRTNSATIKEKEYLVKIAREFGLDLREDIELDGFSEACYNDNSIEDLVVALRSGVDLVDCENWNLTESEWEGAIKDALTAIIRRAFNLD